MKDVSAKKYLTQNAKSTVIRVGFSTISTLLIIPFIIRSIGLTNYSYVSITSFFISFSGLFDIGLSKSLVYLINSSNETPEQKDKYITGIHIINVVILSIVLLFGLCAFLLNINILGKNIGNDNDYYGIVTICSIMILALSIYNTYQSAMLESFFLLEHSNYGVMLKVMSLNLLYIVNLVTINNTELYIASPLVSLLIITVYYNYILHKNIRYNFSIPDMSIWIKIFKYSYDFCKIGILNSVNAALPNLTLMYIGNNIIYIGIFEMISKIALSVINLFSNISRPLYALTRNNPEKIRRKIPVILFIYALFAISFICITYIFRYPIISYLFKDATVETSFLAMVLMIYIIGNSLQLLCQPLSQFLMGASKYNDVSRFLFINTLIFLFSIFLFRYIFRFDLLITLCIGNCCIYLIYTILLLISYKNSHNSLVIKT